MDSAPKLPNPTNTEAITKYLEVETKYMPAAGFYTDSGNARIRSQAVSIIATHSPTISPDAFIPYLAMNYFDRYFSTVQFQDVQDVKSDSEKVRLIALCCLFLSTKMRIETFSVNRFMGDRFINFTNERIMEMELKILDLLQWRMLPVTAFVYLDYYYRFFKSLGGFKRRCINEIIVQAQGENEFVCYKPSQIAMSAFLVAAKIAYPSEYSKHHYQEEEELSECVRAFSDLCGRKNIAVEPSDDELIAILTDEIGNKTHLEEGLLDWKQKASVDEIVEIDEEAEKRKLAKGKAVAMFETYNEEKQRLAKEKTMAVYSEIFSEERQRQPPKSISEEEKKKLDKEEQEKIHKLEAAIKLAMGKGKLEKGVQVGGSLELEMEMDFDLKWPAYVPS